MNWNLSSIKISFVSSLLSLKFTGELLIYDLSSSENVSPIMTGDSGGGSITKVMWIPSHSSSLKTFHLVSTTNVGAILVWSMQLTKELLTLISGSVNEKNICC